MNSSVVPERSLCVRIKKLALNETNTKRMMKGKSVRVTIKKKEIGSGDKESTCEWLGEYSIPRSSNEKEKNNNKKKATNIAREKVVWKPRDGSEVKIKSRERGAHYRRSSYEDDKNRKGKEGYMKSKNCNDKAKQIMVVRAETQQPKKSNARVESKQKGESRCSKGKSARVDSQQKDRGLTPEVMDKGIDRNSYSREKFKRTHAGSSVSGIRAIDVLDRKSQTIKKKSVQIQYLGKSLPENRSQLFKPRYNERCVASGLLSQNDLVLPARVILEIKKRLVMKASHRLGNGLESSMLERINSNGDTWNCTPCHTSHSRALASNKPVPILLSDSQLISIQKRQGMKNQTDEAHIEVYAQSGADLDTLTSCLLEMYGMSSSPLVVALCGGYIDLVRVKDPMEIKEKLLNLKDLLKRRSAVHGLFGDCADSLFICSFSSSPEALWVRSLKTQNDHPNFNERGERIKLLNDFIKHLNDEEGVTGLEKIGLHGKTSRERSKSLVDGSIKKHYGLRLGKFRASESNERKLHFSDKTACEIKKDIISFLLGAANDKERKMKTKKEKDEKEAQDMELDRDDLHEWDLDLGEDML